MDSSWRLSIELDEDLGGGSVVGPGEVSVEGLNGGSGDGSGVEGGDQKYVNPGGTLYTLDILQRTGGVWRLRYSRRRNPSNLACACSKESGEEAMRALPSLYDGKVASCKGPVRLAIVEGVICFRGYFISIMALYIFSISVTRSLDTMCMT